MIRDRRILVSEIGEAKRLDKFLSDLFPDISRAYLQGIIQKGLILHNGRPGKKGSPVLDGDEVLIRELLHPDERALAPNEGLPLPVLHEAPSYLVIDKPAGMPTHPNRYDETDTLVNALLARYPEILDVGDSRLRSGIVHRLDVGTSGLLAVARTEAAFTHLRSQFHKRRVLKEYMALVVGEVEAGGTIEAPIGHDPKSARRMKVFDRPEEAKRYKARDAYTAYAVERRFAGHTLLRVRIRTGRMHQIRIHLAGIGYPVAGDPVYLGPRFRALDLTGLGRQFLHSARLGFDSPEADERPVFTSPLPPDLGEVLEKLNLHRGQA